MLQQAVLHHCEARFAEIFGRPWEPDCKTGLVASHGQALLRNQKALEPWAELRSAVRKIEKFLDKEQLIPVTRQSAPRSAARVGTGMQRHIDTEQVAKDVADSTDPARSLAAWFEEHGCSVGAAKKSAAGSESLRNFVIDVWEFVDPRYLPYQPPPPQSMGYKPMATFRTQPDNQTRELSNGELAIVSLLCGNWPQINQSDLDVGVSIGKILDRESKNIKHARKHRRGPM